MLKALQILALILTGLLFVSCTYLISTYWENFKVVPAAIIAYSSYISLVLLKDKTRIFSNVFNWIWATLLNTSIKLISINVLLLALLVFVTLNGYKKYVANKYNAYVTVFKETSANYLKNEKVELFNLITGKKLNVETDQNGRALLKIDVPSVWRKTYKNFVFPEERIDAGSIPYGFKVDIATLKTNAEEIKINSPGEDENISLFQMPDEYLKRLLLYDARGNGFNADDYLLKGISHLQSFVKRNGFLVSYNSLLKVPNCVAYKILPTENKFGREAIPFSVDTALNSANPGSYRGSGYDRGNLVARSDMFCYGKKAILETYLTSTIAPQAPGLNRSTWRKLEEYTRSFTSKGAVYVVAGVLFLNKEQNGNISFPVIGSDRIAVPSHYYRIISRMISGKISALGFVIANTNEVGEDIKVYQVSISEIEKLSGFQYFIDLSKQEQKSVKDQIDKLW
jgi:DNA/RNA endonuclease G (NUC1)